MTELKENQGIPRHILIMMAVMAGITVANLYYNQPLLELIRHDTGATEVEANLITVISQAGYALGLFLIIPTGDLYPRRRIIALSLITAAAMGTVIAVSDSIGVIWGASLFLGMCSVIPQLFIPIAGQFSKPENKARNIGYVLSGLLTGILASRVISGFIGERMGWRAVFVISAALMAACLAVTAAMMPEMKPNFRGSYPQLMRTVWRIVRTQPRIRLNAVRSSLAFGSMLAIWSCLAFHLAGEPFRAGASTTGVLGLCGMAGAIAASGMGRLVPRIGVRSWVSPIGSYPVEVETEFDADAFTVSLAEGSQFEFSIDGIDGIDGAADATNIAAAWRLPATTPDGVVFDGTADGTASDALTVKGHLTTLPVGSTFTLGVDVSWTAGGKHYERHYTLTVHITDITDAVFKARRRLPAEWLRMD